MNNGKQIDLISIFLAVIMIATILSTAAYAFFGIRWWAPVNGIEDMFRELLIAFFHAAGFFGLPMYISFKEI